METSRNLQTSRICKLQELWLARSPNSPTEISWRFLNPSFKILNILEGILRNLRILKYPWRILKKPQDSEISWRKLSWGLNLEVRAVLCVEDPQKNTPQISSVFIAWGSSIWGYFTICVFEDLLPEDSDLRIQILEESSRIQSILKYIFEDCSISFQWWESRPRHLWWTFEDPREHLRILK